MYVVTFHSRIYYCVYFRCEIPNVGKNSEGTPQTLKDLLAAERDAKRRRQAYRKKNPGQDRKKSDTEVSLTTLQV